MLENLNFIGFFQANIFAIITLILIYANIKKHIYEYDLEQKIYSYLVVSNCAMLILDIVRMYVDGKTGYCMHIINVISTTTMIMYTPILPMLWTIYIDYKIFIDKKRLRRIIKIIIIPAGINIILTIISLIGGINGKFVFQIDSLNVYHRGDLYIFMVLASYIYMFYSFICLVKNRSLVDAIEYKSLKLFALPPFIGGIMQSMIFGLKLTWISMAMSMLIIFIYVQNNLLNVDVLTGLYNRRNLDKYLNNLFNLTTKNKFFGGVLVDINDFKYINDNFGHDKGDIALKFVAKMLKEGFNKEDYIFRYAGDEFVIICDIEDMNELKERIINLDKVIGDINKKANLPYSISMSKGYSVFMSNDGINSEEFIRKLDKLMYKDKSKHKKRKKLLLNKQ